MRAKKRKTMMASVKARGSSETKAMGGYSPRQHQDVVPSMGQGPQGTAAVMIPFGAAPACPEPPVGAGKGFKGWR